MIILHQEEEKFYSSKSGEEVSINDIKGFIQSKYDFIIEDRDSRDVTEAVIASHPVLNYCAMKEAYHKASRALQEHFNPKIKDAIMNRDETLCQELLREIPCSVQKSLLIDQMNQVVLEVK